MTATFLAPLLTERFFDNNGNPLVNGTVTTYQGGTNTPIATYVDSTGTTANTNPVVLNFRGEASIWLLPNVSYKFVVADSLGNLISTIDNVVNASLVSLYGGVDTGVANAYILNFASPVPANTNGQVVYWLPSHSNTGPSTINVNGAGVQAILNPNGTPLGANQILVNQFVSIISINGTWQLYGGSGTGVNVGTFGAEVPLPAASTVDLGSVPGHNVLITGTGTITSFGTSAQTVAPIYVIRFAVGGCILTPSASLILPGGGQSYTNAITTSPGDACIAEYMGSGNWRVLLYQYISPLGGIQSPNCTVKSADTSRQSTTTPTVDPDLSLTLFIGQYEYEAFLLFDSVAAGAGFKLSSTGTAVDSRGTSPAVGTGLVNAAAYGPKLESFVGGTLSYATVGTTANSNGVLYKGSLLVTTPGTFGIAWAQAASTASNTTLRAGSYLVCTLIGQKTSTAPLVHIYNAAATTTEVIPAGYSTCTIEGWGPTARNGLSFTGGGGTSGGGGSGSGGYFRHVVSVSGAGGQTMNYTVGTHGGTSGTSTTVTSGTFTVASLTATSGGPGGSAPNLTVGGTGGSAGVGSGANTVNQTGNPGQAGTNNAGGGVNGSGGAGIPGINYGGPNGVAGGATFVNGSDGAIAFAYS